MALKVYLRATTSVVSLKVYLRASTSAVSLKVYLRAVPGDSDSRMMIHTREKAVLLNQIPKLHTHQQPTHQWESWQQKMPKIKHALIPIAYVNSYLGETEGSNEPPHTTYT